MTRAPDRPPCATTWQGRRVDDPCDDCGHMLIQHVIDGVATCVICALLDTMEGVNERIKRLEGKAELAWSTATSATRAARGGW